MTGDGQRRGARRDDGVSLSDERGPKNGFGKPLRNESAGDKGTCSRAPEDLGAALRHTVSPMLWSYDSLARGGSLYPLTAGARGKYGGKIKLTNPTALLCRGVLWRCSLMNQAFTKNETMPNRRRTMDATSIYEFELDKREYIVEPVFKSEGEASLFSLLLNLMRLDAMG